MQQKTTVVWRWFCIFAVTSLVPMNDPEVYRRLERAENQIQALNRALIQAYKLLHHFSLMMPEQSTGIYDRQLIQSQIDSLETLKPRKVGK